MGLAELAVAAARVAEGSGKPYAFVGGLAVNLWVPEEKVRPTYDVDFLLEISDLEVPSVETRFEDLGVKATRTASFVLDRVVFQRFLCDGTVVDFLAPPAPLAVSALNRRRSVRLGGLRTFVLAPEDLILVKALAWRPQDRRDAEVLAVSLGAHLDRRYLEDWARRLRVWARVRPALR